MEKIVDMQAIDEALQGVWDSFLSL